MEIEGVVCFVSRRSGLASWTMDEVGKDFVVGAREGLQVGSWKPSRLRRTFRRIALMIVMLL